MHSCPAALNWQAGQWPGAGFRLRLTLEAEKGALRAPPQHPLAGSYSALGESGR